MFSQGEERPKVLKSDTTWTNAAKMGPEEWYEMYFTPFHPELALLGMPVLA